MFEKKIKAGLGNHQPQKMYGVFPNITSCWLNWCSEFKELRCEVTSWSNGLLWICLQEYTRLEAIQRIFLKDDGWRMMMTSGFNACKCELVICMGGLSQCWNWYGDTGSMCVCVSMFYCPTFLVCSRKYHLSFFLPSMYLVLWFWIENFGLHNILVEKGSPRCYFYRLALGKWYIKKLWALGM